MKRIKHDVIGRTYGKNNQLKVIGISAKKSDNGRELYNVHCSMCALDSELFGDGNFVTTKSRIVKNIIPCGCSSSPYYSEAQVMIMLNRALLRKNYELLGFNEKYKGLKTNIKVRCNKDGNTWNIAMNRILKSEEGCVECWKIHLSKRRTISDEDNISMFLSAGRIKDGTIFTNLHKQNNAGVALWRYKCGKCSYDEYVLNGVCSGIFECASMQLRTGHLSCRCSSSYRWSLEQREYQVKKSIKERNIDVSFVGFENYKTKKFKVKLLCHKHGEYSAIFNDFMNKKTQCMSCAKSGYNSKNDAVFYVTRTESLSVME